jgi:hypothetical protein
LTKKKSGECEYKPKQECLDSFDVSKRTFLQTLHEALDSRFSYADHGLVKATQIVDFKCWPDSSEKSEVEGITLGCIQIVLFNFVFVFFI